MDAPVTFQPGTQPILYDYGQIRIRRMTRDDADFVGKVLVDSFRGKFVAFTGERYLPESILAVQEEHREISNYNHDVFVAEVDGALAGVLKLKYSNKYCHEPLGPYWRHLPCWKMPGLLCGGICLHEDVPAHRCYISEVGVDERFRGKGVGKCFMEVANREAIKNNCWMIYLKVSFDNRAIHLYERSGYKNVRTEDCCTKCIIGIDRFYVMEKRLSPHGY